MPIKGQSKTTNTRTCRVFHKNDTYWGKMLDRCLAKTICNLRLFSVEETNPSPRHAKIQREDDGAIEFWRINDNLQEHFLFCHHWSDDKWKKSMAGGRIKKRYQYCTDSSGAILYLRALQGHSGRSLISPTLHKTMSLFRATSSSTLIMSDVQSIYIPSSIRD